MLEMLAKDPFYFKWQVALVQMAGFALFFLVLKTLLFDRLLNFMKRRDEELAAAAARIAAARKEIASMTAELESRLAAADKVAYDEAQKAVREGIAAKAAILQSAQDESRRIVEEARAAIAAEKAAALRSLDAQVDALAAEVASSAAAGTAFRNDSGR